MRLYVRLWKRNMRHKAILDTGFFYATIDKKDRNHLQVIQARWQIFGFDQARAFDDLARRSSSCFKAGGRVT